ncbi:DDE-type integrase/transposase/recombinase [Streptomyces sp. NPDC000410]|uniref:DDE-type integrase/transposase/recombinase n=1 Tax=Streptomyces sp. NPDC000410 TaxID=3154254 RepID=UPI00331DE8D3
MHHRAADARDRHRRCRPRREGDHHDAGPGRHPGPGPARPRLRRPAPKRTWVAGFTHVATWSGAVYVAFVVDAFSRHIVGWAASITRHTQLVLDAVEMALWQRDRDGWPPTPGELMHHSDAGSQYTSFKLAEHLDAGRQRGVHRVGR